MFDSSVDHNIARLGGSLDFANAGSSHSRIFFYSTTQPARGADPGGAPLVEVTLAKPVGVIGSEGVLQLVQDDPTGDMVVNTGSVLWGRWINGDGALVGDGDASDAAGDGFFKMSGTAGTMLYAGARMLLGVCALT